MGRLHELIGDTASVASMGEGVLLNVLAEAILAKTETIAGLRRPIEERG